MKQLWKEYIQKVSPELNDDVCELSFYFYLSSLVAPYFVLYLLKGVSEGMYLNMWLLFYGEPHSLKTPLLRYTIEPLFYRSLTEIHDEDNQMVYNLSGSYEALMTILSRKSNQVVVFWSDEAGPLLIAPSNSYVANLRDNIVKFSAPHTSFTHYTRKHVFSINDITLNLIIATQPVFLERIKEDLILSGFLPRFFPAKLPPITTTSSWNISQEEIQERYEDHAISKLFFINFAQEFKATINKAMMEHESWVNARLQGKPFFYKFFWTPDAASFYDETMNKLWEYAKDKSDLFKIWFKKLEPYALRFSALEFLSVYLVDGEEWWRRDDFILERHHIKKGLDVFIRGVEVLEELIENYEENYILKQVIKMLELLKRCDGALTRAEIMSKLRLTSNAMEKVLRTAEEQGKIQILNLDSGRKAHQLIKLL